MSLITEYNLSFSDIENCTAPRKPRSIKPQQYVKAVDYKRELLTKLPQIASTKSTIKDGDVKDGTLDGGLGIKGVGKLHNDSQESFKYNKTERRKRKRKRRQKHSVKFSEDCYDNDDESLHSSGPSLLPSIQSKKYTCENKANPVEKSGKTMAELADYFRCYHGSNDKLPQTTLQRSDHGGQKFKNSKKNTDVLLAEAIERDKNSQKQASKQLERSVLQGRGMGHTCPHH